MEWLDLVKVYGPLALGWVVAAYLGKFILSRYDKDIAAKVELAGALNTLTKLMEARASVLQRLEDSLNRRGQ